jgi:hypothetical protein
MNRAFDLIVQAYPQAVKDARHGDQEAIEFLNIVAPDKVQGDITMDIFQEIESARSKIESASKNFETNRAQLFRSDGTPKYAEKEHKERLAVILQPLQESVGKARDLTAQAIQEANRIENAAPPNVMAHLSTEDLQRAVLLDHFVAVEVAGMSLEHLSQRLHEAQVGQDRAAQAVYLLHGQKRAAALRGDHNVQTRPVREMMKQIDQSLSALTVAITKKSIIDPSQIRKVAGELTMFAGQTLDAADGTKAAVIAEQQRWSRDQF